MIWSGAKECVQESETDLLFILWWLMWERTLALELMVHNTRISLIDCGYKAVRFIAYRCECEKRPQPNMVYQCYECSVLCVQVLEPQHCSSLKGPTGRVQSVLCILRLTVTSIINTMNGHAISSCIWRYWYSLADRWRNVSCSDNILPLEARWNAR